MKRRPFILPAVISLVIGCWLSPATSAVAQGITGTNVIALSDFDTALPGWDYGYFYAWGWPPSGEYTNGTYGVTRPYTDPLIDPTNGPLVIRYAFTNAPYYELITTNSGAGYGTGFGGPQVWGLDPSVFNNLYLTNYLFDFDARVDGLASGMTSGNCEMQVQIYAGAKILQKNIAFNPGSNWTHFAYSLDDGGFADATSYTTFTNGLASINDIRFNVNLHMPQGEFGWDDYNVVLIDNMKLSVVQFTGPPPPPPPTVPFAILDWNMDDKPLDYTYGGYNWSQNSFLATFTYSTNIADMAGYGVGGSNAWWLQMDNTVLASPNTPQWAGGGTGGSGPVDFARFTSGDLRKYRLSFDSRGQGLSGDITTTCAAQFFLDSPNGNLRLDFAVPAGSNWVTSSYLLNSGNAGVGSKASFVTNYNTYTACRLQWQIENAQSIDWDYDANNGLFIDNIKLERIDVGCPPLSINVSGTNIVVTWAQPSTGSAKLQGANNLSSAFADINGATSPYSIPIASAPRYFRTQWVPPP